jgi:cellulase/cellobiase CelA1
MYSISDYGINNDSLHAQIFLLVNNAMGAVTSGRSTDLATSSSTIQSS